MLTITKKEYKEALRELKKEQEIICLTPSVQALLASVALNELYKGKQVKAMLVKGWEK